MRFGTGRSAEVREGPSDEGTHELMRKSQSRQDLESLPGRQMDKSTGGMSWACARAKAGKLAATGAEMKCSSTVGRD